MPGRNEPCHCGSGRKYKKCHGSTVALQREAERYGRIGLRGAPGRFSEEAYYGPVAPLREVLTGVPFNVPDEIGPHMVSKLLATLDPGDQMPAPIWAGRASPVEIDADPVAPECFDRVRARIESDREAHEMHEGTPVSLYRGRTGGLMLECDGDAPPESVARAAIAWSVAANDGNLCLWGGRLRTGDWLLGLTA